MPNFIKTSIEDGLWHWVYHMIGLNLLNIQLSNNGNRKIPHS
jgi:hypothetical protein